MRRLIQVKILEGKGKAFQTEEPNSTVLSQECALSIRETARRSKLLPWLKERPQVVGGEI